MKKNILNSLIQNRTCLLVISVFILSVFAGCQGGTGAGVQDDAGQPGSLKMNINWPGNPGNGKLIPQGSDTLTVAITGEGLEEALVEEFTGLAGGSYEFVIQNIPTGPKTAVIQSKKGGKITAQRKVSFVIEAGRETDSGNLPLGVAVKDVNGDIVFEPSSITADTGDSVVFQNWTDQIVDITGFWSFSLSSVSSGPDGISVFDEHTVNPVKSSHVATGAYNHEICEITMPQLGNGTFQSRVTYTCGSVPRIIKAVDLNGDRAPDIVTANYGDNSVSVFLNNGSGTLSAKSDYPVNTGVWSMNTGDADGDGYHEIVTFNNSSTSTVSVLPNDGDGTFGTRTNYLCGTSTRDGVIADMDGDDIPDLLACNYQSDNFSLYPGLGNGNFGSRTNHATGAGPEWITTADLNGDGVRDIISADFDSGNITVRTGDGDGTFGALNSYLSGTKPVFAKGADLDGDDVPDIVSVNMDSNIFSVFMGNGDGTFQPRVYYTVGSSPRSADIGDINGDSIPDVVVSNYSSDSVSLFLGDGDGTFTSSSTVAVGDGPRSVCLTDLDGDRKLDIVTTDQFDNTISVLFGN